MYVLYLSDNPLVNFSWNNKPTIKTVTLYQPIYIYTTFYLVERVPNKHLSNAHQTYNDKQYLSKSFKLSPETVDVKMCNLPR